MTDIGLPPSYMLMLRELSLSFLTSSCISFADTREDGAGKAICSVHEVHRSGLDGIRETPLSSSDVNCDHNRRKGEGTA